MPGPVGQDLGLIRPCAQHCAALWGCAVGALYHLERTEAACNDWRSERPDYEAESVLAGVTAGMRRCPFWGPGRQGWAWSGRE